MKQLFFSLFLVVYMCRAMQDQDQHWSSVTYEAATHQFNAAVKLINEHITDFSQRPKILDIGCGPGNVTFYLAQKIIDVPNAHIHGIDKSPDMIRAAKAKNTYKDQVTFDIFDGNTDQLSFVDQFDIIFSSATLHWIKNQEALFNGIARSTAKDGIILIKAATMSTDHPLLKAFNDLKQNEPWKSVFFKIDLTMQFFPLLKPIVEQWCESNRLKIEEIYIQPNNFTFSNAQQLESWFNSWFQGFPVIAKLSQERRNAFATALVAQYAPSITNKENGTLTHGWPQLILKATKPYRSSGPDQSSNHHIIS